MRETLFVWLGRCTGGRREDVRTEEQDSALPGGELGSIEYGQPPDGP